MPVTTDKNLVAISEYLGSPRPRQPATVTELLSALNADELESVAETAVMAAAQYDRESQFATAEVWRAVAGLGLAVRDRQIALATRAKRLDRGNPGLRR